MADVTLKSGRVVAVDVSEMTVKEWRDFIDPRGTAEVEDKVVAKCAGMTQDEIDALTWEDFRRLARAVVLTAQEPLSDPN